MKKFFKAATTLVKTQKGMSLMEILIVLAIIAFIGTTILKNVTSQQKKAKVSETKTLMVNVVSSLNQYYSDCGRFPKELTSLIKAPDASECSSWGPDAYVKNEKGLKDAWNNTFHYESDSSTFTLKSLGADGREGGTGYDADMSSDDIMQ
jgi:general secretion pathway protein G